MPLPEFILKKMLVPDSFRYTKTGFSFDLKNTYAPGSITKLSLISNSGEIPLEKIGFHVDGQPLQKATEISSSHPATFPTGVRVTVSAVYPGECSSLIISAETKEVGTVRFAVLSEKPSIRNEPPWMVNWRKPRKLPIPSLTPGEEFDSCLLGVLGGPFSEAGSFNPIQSNSPLVVLPFSSSSTGDHWGKRDFSCMPNAKITGSHTDPSNWCQTGPSGQSRIIPLIDSEHDQIDKNIDPGLNESDLIILGGNTWEEWELSNESAKVYARKINRARAILEGQKNPCRVGCLVKSLVKDDNDHNYSWNQTFLENLQKPVDLVYWQVPDLDHFLEIKPSVQIHWLDIHNQATSMIDRLDEQITSAGFNRPHTQAIDLSRLFSSLECRFKLDQTSKDAMDLPFFLFTFFAALASRSERIAFATVLEDASFNPISTLSSAYSMLLHHFVDEPSSDQKPANGRSTTLGSIVWSSDQTAGAMTTITKDGQNIKMTAFNANHNRKLHLILPALKGRTVHLDSTFVLLKDGLIKPGTSCLLNRHRSRLIPPRSMVHFTFSVDGRGHLNP
jgi:hypothetical protein